MNKNKNFLAKNKKGCSLELNNDIKEKQEKLENELKNILKKFDNNPGLIIDYLEKHKTKVIKNKKSKKILSFLNQEPGFIPEQKGINALIINLTFFKKISLKSESMFILDDKFDIYNLIQQFYKWYFIKNGLFTFDARIQSLIKQIDKGDSHIIDKLSLNETIDLRKAVALDIQSIDFVTQYTRETIGSQNAFDKIKEDSGANV